MQLAPPGGGTRIRINEFQRGTNHAWAKRGDEVARVAFVLVDGEFDPALAEQITI